MLLSVFFAAFLAVQPLDTVSPESVDTVGTAINVVEPPKADFYWVRFADKKGTAGAIDKPQQYLSQRAMQRRQRLGIAIDSLDLPVDTAYIGAVGRLGATIHNVTKWLNGTTVVADSATASAISELPFVVQVARYAHRRLPEAYGGMADTVAKHYDRGQDTSAIDYTLFDDNYYNLGATHIQTVGGSDLHRMGYEGQGVLVGVCDGGFPGVDTLSAFQALRDEKRLIASRDFVEHRPSVYYASSHGTMVLSTMASYIPGLYVGTAPKASYVLCITEDDISENPVEELNWVSALEYLDSLGVDVVNTSLGYIRFEDSTLSHHASDLDGNTAWMSRGAEIAISRGIACVVSAGNSGAQGERSISVPADAKHVLTVGAVWPNNIKTDFSSWGPTADGNIKPDVTAQGILVCIACPSGGYMRGAGTSFSSPITAGMVACLRGARPNASIQQLFDAIRLSSSHAGQANNKIGYGLPDFRKALSYIPCKAE